MSSCHIIPPYLINRLTAHPDDRIATCARKTLQQDEFFRARPAAVPTAHQGVIADAGHAANATADRAISDAQNTTDLPGTLVRSEGDPPSDDVAVNEAYDGLGDTFDLYLSVYGRDSIDGEGLPLAATVHYDNDYDNAFWNGAQMVFGDGDGEVFNRFTSSLDVIGHELTHGVTEHTAQLVYQDQSGALNESISDVFGALVKQRKLGQTADQADWLIGAELFTDAVQGVALRSMKDPGTAYDDDVLGKDPQPATMDDYVQTTEDNGGVHINSGIPNKAFYLAATTIGGNAWEGAGQIWYDVLTGSEIGADTDFAGFAALTLAAATARFGAGSPQERAVADAWSGVGLEVGGGGEGDGGEGGPVPTQPPVPTTGEIRVIRTGGYAGLRMERVVHPDQLEEDVAQQWRGLLGSSLLRELAAEPRVPDGFTYRVVAPGHDLDVTAGELQFPEDVRSLFNRTLKQ